MVLKGSSPIRLSILTPGYLSANSQGFLHPLLVNRGLLKDCNLDLKIFTNNACELQECDALLIDSKYFMPHWHNDSARALEVISKLAEKVPHILWFHTGDSAGSLGAYCKKILPLVSGVYKSQVYREKSLYQKRLYGNRLFSDYYHREFGIQDSVATVEDDSILSDEELKKIRVSWNIGYARCFHFYGEYLTKLYRAVGVPWILNLRPKIHHAKKFRRNGIYARMGASFPRQTIAYQREKLLELLGKQPRVSRNIYYREMKQSKIVVSPFGWGEINNRDFECFIYGCLLVKPSVNHLETFPKHFCDGETYLSYKWDMSDMAEVLEDSLHNYRIYLDTAIEGQRRYVRSTMSEQGKHEFVEHFMSILDSTRL